MTFILLEKSMNNKIKDWCEVRVWNKIDRELCFECSFEWEYQCISKRQKQLIEEILFDTLVTNDKQLQSM